MKNQFIKNILVFLLFLSPFWVKSQCNVGSNGWTLTPPNSCGWNNYNIGAGEYEFMYLDQGVSYQFSLTSSAGTFNWGTFFGQGVCINGTGYGNVVNYTAPTAGTYSIGTNRLGSSFGYYWNGVSATLSYAPITPGNPGAISGTNVLCQGGTATYSIGSVSYAKDYLWQITVDGGASYNTITPTGGTSVSITWPNVVTTAAYVRVLAQNGPCTSSAWSYYNVNLLATPTAPTTATKTPNVAEVCKNETVGLSGPASGGTDQSCSIEYRYSIDAGATWSNASTTVPTGLSSAISGVNRIQIQSRRNNCNANCLATTAWNTVATWNVDVTPPVVITQNINVNLNANGTYSLLASQVNNNTFDNCAVSTMTVSPSSFTCANIGPNTVTLTATDNVGNSTSATAIVTVHDATGPTVAVQNIFLALNASGTGSITPAMINNGSTDACGIASYSLDVTQFDCDDVGSNTVQLTVTDIHGNSSTAPATVIVQDLINPVLNLQDITVNLNANGVANLTPAMIDNGSTDNCTVTLFTIPSSFNCNNVGQNTVLVLGSDNGNNVVFSSVVVTVVDAINPTITAPSNITTYANASCAATGLSLGTPVTADNCSVTSVTNNAPSPFPLGVTTVTWTVTDASGNTATATQTVTVLDNTNPTVTLPTIVTVPANNTCVVPNNSGNIAFGLLTNDNCSIGSATNNGPSNFPLGYSSITWTIVDGSGNTVTANQTIQVEDQTNPTITAPATVTVNANAACSATGVVLGTPTTSDNCQVVSVINNAPVTYPIGTTPVTWTVIDAAGNTATAIQNVVVVDNSLPVITCPAGSPFNRNNTANLCAYVAVGTEFNPTATDNCQNTPTLTHNYSSWSNPNTLAGATFPVGTTNVIWTATDAAGNTATCTQSIVVVDAQAPTIQGCPSGLTLSVGQYNCGTTPNWTIPTASDNCTLSSMTQTSGPSSTALLSVGSYNVNYTAIDISGNTSTCAFSINVLPTSAPIIVCPNNITNQATNSNACFWTSTSAVNPIQSMGNCPTLTWSITNPNASISNGTGNISGFNFQKGTSTITYTLTDNLNVASTCTSIVTVIDNILPSITAPANVTVSSNSGCSATGVALGTPVTADNCSVATVTNNAPTSFPSGNTTVTWTVTDANGNIATATQTVTVTDNSAPVITCPSVALIRNASAGSCDYTIQGTEANVSATDNCGLTSMVHNYTSASSSTTLANAVFNVGTTTVIWTATDASGNVTTCTQTIQVVDNQAPVFANCPANMTIGTYTGCTGGTIWTAPTATDNCSSATVTQTSGPTSGTTLTAGVYTIVYTASDAAGNTATCSFTITVNATSAPVIQCPTSATYNTTIPSGCSWISPSGSLAPTLAAANCPNTVTWTISNPNGTTSTGITNASGYVFNSGVSTLTYTITDPQSATAQCSTTITVIETVLPTIIAPANVSVNTNTGCTATGISIGTPVTSDNCTVASVTNNAPSIFTVGNTTVTWTVLDAAGNTATATQVITVTDNVVPTITAPAAMTVSTNTACTATGVSLGTPVTADNCSVASVVNNAPTAFPLGNTTVTWTVTDASGLTATATQVITVVDNTNPSISAPANISVNANSACAAFNVNLGTPIATDNCSVASVVNNAPSVFSLGATNVTWTVTDASGNTATATQVVTVVDNTNPTIVAPAAMTVQTNTACTATGVVLGTPVTTDNCTVASVTNNAPVAFPLGNTTVTWTVTDAVGNLATATQVITVIDNVNPTITAPVNITANATASCAVTGLALGTPVTADNCSVASVTNNAPSTFPLGTTTITWTVIDGSGRTATATQTVTVIDNTNPTITAPANVTVNANNACAAFNVALGTPVTSDNCSVASVVKNAPTVFPLGITIVTWTVTDGSGLTATATQVVTVVDNTNPTIVAPAAMTVQTNTACTATGVVLGNPLTNDNCSIASVSNNAPVAFPLGNTTVTWTVTDGSGNTSTATQVITVIDNVNPTITAPANITINATASCAVTGLALGTPVTADNCSVASVTNNAPSTFSLGTTTITWTVIDGSGRTATATQTVTVVDNTNPTITAPANVTVNANNACAAFNVALGTPVTADNCTVASVANNAPSVFPLGNTTVTWTVTDGAGLTATATQVVTVVDIANPSIIAPTAISVSANNACTATGVVLGTPITFDNCSISSVSNNAPLTFPLGSTTVTWTATDGSGNIATATQLVTVMDSVNPTITAPLNLTINANAACTATGVALGTPVTADNCSVASVTNNAPSTFQIGATNVTWIVTDGSGNIASATQTVTVVDNTNPTITAPANVSVNANSSCAAFNVALGTPVTADNCSVASVANNAPTVFPLGNTTVTWTVTDGAGLTAIATQVVTVVDNTNPTIVAPIALTVSTNTACTATGVVLGNPVTNDNCTVASVTNNAPVAFPLGNTTVTWTVTDGSGNTSTATQVVTVVDNVNPIISAPANITTNASASCAVTGLALGTPVTSDNCSVVSVTNNAPVTFVIGTTTVTWTVTDASGNTATAIQTVTIVDNTIPTITAPANVTLNANSACSAFNVALGTPVTSDNCSIASVTNNAPTVFPIGTTTVTWTVTDAAGLTAATTQTVTIVDQIVPVIYAPVEVITYANSNCEATNVNLGIPVTSDNCTVASVVNNGLASFPIGTTTVTWTVTDGYGNTATAQQLVTVLDTISPTAVITNISVNLLTTGPVEITAQDVAGASFDNCGVSTIELSKYAFNCSDLGINTVLVTITDNYGNKTQVNAEVTVLLSGYDLDFDGIDDGCDPSINVSTIEIPNGFTPDGDNYNDQFVIPGLTSYTSIELHIYDRYGNMVYESANYANDWNGTSMKGNELPDDTYFYVLTLDGTENRQGYVYINRVK